MYVLDLFALSVPGRASRAIDWMSIELGVPFEARLVDSR